MVLSAAAAHGIVFGTLAVFGLTALASLRSEAVQKLDRDTYFAARNTQNWIALSLSFFASGVGAWVLFAVAETGTQAGSIGVAGYAIAVCVPLAMLTVVAPYMRENLPHGVTFSDYLQQRGGAEPSQPPWLVVAG